MNKGKGTIEILFGDREKFAFSRILVKENINASCLEEALAEVRALSTKFKNSQVKVNANINGVMEIIQYSTVWPIAELLNDYAGRIDENKFNYFVKVCNIKNKVLKVSDVTNYNSINDLNVYITNAIEVKRNNPKFKVVIDYRGYCVEVMTNESITDIAAKLSKIDSLVYNAKLVANRNMTNEEYLNDIYLILNQIVNDRSEANNQVARSRPSMVAVDLGKYNTKNLDVEDFIRLISVKPRC